MKIKELWIYPVKGCQGINIPRAQLTPSGFLYDRAFCIIDLDGQIVSKHEAISMRKLPCLATIKISISVEDNLLRLESTDKDPIELPLEEGEYVDSPDVMVECSGKSTTTGGGWSLGFIPSKLANNSVNEWISSYLNAQIYPGKLRHGKSKTSRFAIARSMSTIKLCDYPPIFPIIEIGKRDGRFDKNEKRFSDFAPFLICNQASLEAVKIMGNVDEYPMSSMRASIIVDSKEAWEEETWSEILIKSPNNTMVTMKKIKECPRCTVPCRNPTSGEFLFKEKLLLWKLLKKAFPTKANDPEWGTWAGVFFGVYFGRASQQGTLHVGDTITVLQDETEGKNLHHIRDATFNRNPRKLILKIVFAVLLFLLLRRARSAFKIA
uniref:MOSC domain-containing protein n=2 Tax=Aplanochytrium stocchinoi TaxID=215587 RepID=A0A7S3PKK9_9STRA